MPAPLSKWFGLFRSGDPLRKVGNAEQRNRISNVLADIQGIGCRVSKPTNGEGMGWRIIVDGGSDIVPDTGGFVAADRKVAIDSTDVSGTLSAKLYGQTATPQDSNDIPVEWDAHDTGGTATARHHISVDIWNGTDTLVYMLGRLANGNHVWVPITDTCSPDTGA